MQNPPQRRVWESLYQLFTSARMIFTVAVMIRSFEKKMPLRHRFVVNLTRLVSLAPSGKALIAMRAVSP
ncbi:hypothetical protein [Sphingobium sp. CAP-1]|uniref:hypothetical protein n=1 Tax=Sphingobium sp. CAP-1 TaxID=2676077 RepID=UPI0012BB27CE|nr:hypothetical protein [Sphingobium sp. CAP-1]QGP79147.1 hypothetical protein GL174_09165 [Sphingobium sp. CAP-1]